MSKTMTKFEKPKVSRHSKTEGLKLAVGEWYDSAKPCDEDKAIRAYNVISQINNVWFDMIPVPVVFQDEDPYDSYADMKETVSKEGILRIFNGGQPTYMSKEDNIKGRAVHDWFGHLEASCDFSFRGEWTKFNHVQERYPAWVRPLLFTEIVGQRGAVSYYDGFSDPRFEQKAVFASDSFMTHVACELQS